MRVLITGAAGFVGSHLSDRFLAEGYTVIGMDNFITGSPDNIAHLADNPDFIFIEQDVSQPFTIDGDLDAVLHFASPASPDGYLKNPFVTMKVHSYGTFNTLDIAREKGARYLFASTSEVYGDPEFNPQPEAYWGNVSSTGPRSVYDEGKRFSEAAIMAYNRYYGLETRMVRIFNTYGPRMDMDDGRVVPNFIRQALTGEPLTLYLEGKTTRSFQYVSDLVEGVYRLLHSDEVMPVNIGNPVEMSILEFAEAVLEVTHSSSEMIFVDPEADRIADDPKVRCPDISKAKRVLDWSPQVNLADGLMKTAADFRERLGLMLA